MEFGTNIKQVGAYRFKSTPFSIDGYSKKLIFVKDFRTIRAGTKCIHISFYSTLQYYVLFYPDGQKAIWLYSSDDNRKTIIDCKSWKEFVQKGKLLNDIMAFETYISHMLAVTKVGNFRVERSDRKGFGRPVMFDLIVYQGPYLVRRYDKTEALIFADMIKSINQVYQDCPDFEKDECYKYHIFAIKL